MAECSLDNDNKKHYALKAAEWNGNGSFRGNDLDVRQKFEKLRNDEQPNRHKDKMSMYAEVTELIGDKELAAPFAYIPSEDVVKYNPNAPHINDYGMDYVFAHEISHRMDEIEYHSWENEKFL